MQWTNDPVADAERYAAEGEKRMSTYPICTDCGETITDDECYDFGDELFCFECVVRLHRKPIENYIKE